jgi:hypothetical protein
MAENRRDDETPAQRTSRALAEAQAEAEKRQADETVPGGRYRLSEDGPLLDAEGKPVKDKQD